MNKKKREPAEQIEGQHGKRQEKYRDIFIFVPQARQIIRISEGNGDNLLLEDIEDGFVDYIYYEQYGLRAGMQEDGGEILLDELLRNRYRSMADCIPDVMEMAYGDRMIRYRTLSQTDASEGDSLMVNWPLW